MMEMMETMKTMGTKESMLFMPDLQLTRNIHPRQTREFIPHRQYDSSVHYEQVDLRRTTFRTSFCNFTPITPLECGDYGEYGVFAGCVGSFESEEGECWMSESLRKCECKEGRGRGEGRGVGVGEGEGVEKMSGPLGAAVRNRNVSGCGHAD
jgi:hypothetical protein